jgi:hypothetical protein
MRLKQSVLLLSIFALSILVAAAPVSASTVSLGSNINAYVKGQLATFFATVKVTVNEKFKVNYMTFKIYDSKKHVVETCMFKTDGTKISGCKAVKYVIPLDKDKHNKWGYHYGKDMRYKVVVDTGKLKTGDYKGRLGANVQLKNSIKNFYSGYVSFKIVKYKPHNPPKKVK